MLYLPFLSDTHFYLTFPHCSFQCQSNSYKSLATISLLHVRLCTRFSQRLYWIFNERCLRLYCAHLHISLHPIEFLFGKNSVEMCELQKKRFPSCFHYTFAVIYYQLNNEYCNKFPTARFLRIVFPFSLLWFYLHRCSFVFRRTDFMRFCGRKTFYFFQHFRFGHLL